MTGSTDRPLRIGAVNYLNSKPLIEGLSELTPQAELILDYPSRLADNLAAGLLDVALIPSIECVRNRGYEVIPDACVAAHGTVLSVKLYSRVPPDEIRSLALDDGSRSSQVLAQILLAKRFGIEPEVELLPPDLSADATSADAVLLIGDRGIHSGPEQFVVTWDLGEEWWAWTGLPLVFSMWATRAGTMLGEVEEALCRARDLGVERIEQIARREAPLLGIPERVARDYLTKKLDYRLGSPEKAGLSLFCRLAVERGLAPEGGDIVYRNCATAGQSG